MKKTMTAMLSAALLLTAATASAQDDTIEEQLDDVPAWTTDIQLPWTEDTVEDMWESEGYDVDD